MPVFRRRKKGEICGYWDCDKQIPDDGFLCERHYEGWVKGLVDRCPKCGRFKETMYQVCPDCYIGREVAYWEPRVVIPTQKKAFQVQYSDAWIDGHMRPDRFFIYIIEFGEGGLYIGHTKDIRKHMAQYQNKKKAPALGSTPKLQYLQIIATKEAAEMREAELKRLIETNPDQIRVMISEFHRHMREFGLE